MNTRNNLYCIEGIVAALKKIKELEEFFGSLRQRLTQLVSKENPHLIKKDCIEEVLISLVGSSPTPKLLEQIVFAYSDLDDRPCRTCSSNIRCVFCPHGDGLYL